jgi:hypothetical protein
MSGKELTITVHEGDKRLSALHVTARYPMIINKELLESTVYDAVKKLGYELTPWQVLDGAKDDPFDYGRGR